MNKKLIILAAAGGLISFCGSFMLAWVSSGMGTGQDSQIVQESSGATRVPEAISLSGNTTVQGSMLREKQLRELIYEVRENIRAYDNKVLGLSLREQRLQKAQDLLKQDIAKLNDLRIELSSTVERLKRERDELGKLQVAIDKAEQGNLKSIASAYDRMDSSSASKILTNMCVVKGSDPSRKKYGGTGSNMEDAVKILYYMAERTKAKLLAEMVNSEPKLAAVLCEKLKRIVETK